MKRRSFTLLEMLIALALATALLGALFAFLFDMLRSRDRALAYAARQRAAAVLVERVETDLLACLVGDGASGAGVRGDEASIRILSRAVPVQLAERGRDDPAAFDDLLESEIRFDEGRRRLEARRRAPNAPAGALPVEWSRLGGEIYLARFRYHDGRAWRDSFDSLQADRLPRAVEVAIWFDPWPGAEPLDDVGAPASDALPPDRLTFDAAGGFDEQAYAEISDLEVFDAPPPDRIRVIIVPDADTDEDAGGDETTDLEILP